MFDTQIPISLEELKLTFYYCQHTGNFYWIKAAGCRKAGSVAGYDTPGGYRYIGFNKVQYLQHRLIWFYVHGEWPKIHLDHANCNKSDNRIFNLREATISQNLHNRGPSSNNTSGQKGVGWREKEKRWYAQIKKDNKNIYLGRFKTFDEASKAYREASKKLLGEFARN